MKNYAKIFMPIGLAILLGSLTFVFAQKSETPNGNFSPQGKDFGKMPPPHGRDGGFNPRIFDQLGLSDEQKTKIRELHEASRTNSQVYFEKLRVLDEKIKDTTETESFDETQARTLLRSKAAIQIELDLIRLKTDAAIYNLLTAEQIAKFEQLKQQRPEFPPHGFRPGMPPPQN